MHEVEWGVLESNWGKLTPASKAQLALLSQILTKTSVCATLLVCSYPEIAAALDRLWAFEDSTGAEIHWRAGGRQPIHGFKGLTQIREEDVLRGKARA